MNFTHTWQRCTRRSQSKHAPKTSRPPSLLQTPLTRPLAKAGLKDWSVFAVRDSSDYYDRMADAKQRGLADSRGAQEVFEMMIGISLCQCPMMHSAQSEGSRLSLG
jgi:hypothetical protein